MRTSAHIYPNTVKATASVGTIVSVEPYEGEYTAEPSGTEQTFETKGKRMTRDFVVEPLKVERVPNATGTTVRIGG